jgi:type II secretory pathway pseudopilin PulG
VKFDAPKPDISYVMSASTPPVPLSCHRARRAGGYTLIDVIITTNIIAILAALVVPQVQGATDEAVLAAARDFEHKLRLGTSLYIHQNKLMPTSFKQWVGLTHEANDRNLIRINRKLRNMLADPEANVRTGQDRIRFDFGNGLRVIYRIDSRGAVRAIYSGPGAD